MLKRKLTRDGWLLRLFSAVAFAWRTVCGWKERTREKLAGQRNWHASYLCQCLCLATCVYMPILYYTILSCSSVYACCIPHSFCYYCFKLSLSLYSLLCLSVIYCLFCLSTSCLCVCTVLYVLFFICNLSLYMFLRYIIYSSSSRSSFSCSLS